MAKDGKSITARPAWIPQVFSPYQSEGPLKHGAAVAPDRFIISAGVPRGLLTYRGLHPVSKLLFITIRWRSRATGICWASLPTLAADVGVSRTQVWVHLKRLKRAGFIGVQRWPGYGSVYWLLAHPIFDGHLYPPERSTPHPSGIRNTTRPGNGPLPSGKRNYPRSGNGPEETNRSTKEKREELSLGLGGGGAQQITDDRSGLKPTEGNGKPTRRTRCVVCQETIEDPKGLSPAAAMFCANCRAEYGKLDVGH